MIDSCKHTCPVAKVGVCSLYYLGNRQVCLQLFPHTWRQDRFTCKPPLTLAKGYVFMFISLSYLDTAGLLASCKLPLLSRLQGWYTCKNLSLTSGMLAFCTLSRLTIRAFYHTAAATVEKAIPWKRPMQQLKLLPQ